MNEHEKRELGKLEELRKTIEASPLTQQIITEKADKVLGERLLAAGKLRAATEEAGRVIPEHQQDVDNLVAELTEYDKGRSVILDKLTSANSELAKARQSLDWEKSHAEDALLSNYDSRIDEAITYFQVRHEELRKQTVNSQKQAESHVETKTITTFSNVGSIRRALKYCMEAIQQLEAMRLVPVFDPAKVERLRAEVPDADVLEEFSATKKRYNDDEAPGLLCALRQAADDRLDYEIGRLHEKAQKLLKRSGR